MFHRCLLCPAHAEKRETDCPEFLQKVADPSDPLFTQGVPRRPRCPPAAAEREVWIGEVPADGALAKGEAFTDGALRGSSTWARRVGWAFVVADAALPMWG